MSDETKVPTIPALSSVKDAATRDVLAAIKELLEVRNGQRGDELDQFVKLRDLIDSGVVNYNPGGKGSRTPGSLIQPIDTDQTDYEIPPAPYDLEVAGGYAQIFLEWKLDPFSSFAYTEIWRNAEDNLATAIVVGETHATLYSDPCGSSKAYYYWVRAVNKAGVPGPFNATAGTYGETAVDVEYLLNILTGQITESQLYKDLGSRIDLIDAPEGLLNSVNNRVASLRSEVVPRVDILDTRLAVLESTDTLVNRKLEELITVNAGQTSDIYLEQQARASADAAQAIQIESVRAFSETGLAAANSRINVLESRDVLLAEKVEQIIVTNSSQTSDIYLEQTARIAGDAANASLIESVRSGTDTKIADVTRRVETLESYDTTLAQKVDQIIVINSGQTSDIYLEQQARLAADAAQATQILQLSAQITGVDAALGEERIARATADTAATTSLNAAISRISASEATIASNYTTLAQADSAQANGITQLSARLNNVDGSGVTVEQKFSSQASLVNGLSAQYSVKIDANGYVAGFGLASTSLGSSTSPIPGGGTGNFSEFYIRADRFAIGSPSVPNGAPGSSTNKVIPFIVQATNIPASGGNPAIPAGVYINDAYIKNGTITNAKIGFAAIDDAKIASLSAEKITFGTMSGDRIQVGTLNGDRIVAGSISSNLIDTNGFRVLDQYGNLVMSAGELGPVYTPYTGFTFTNSTDNFYAYTGAVDVYPTYVRFTPDYGGAQFVSGAFDLDLKRYPLVRMRLRRAVYGPRYVVTLGSGNSGAAGSTITIAGVTVTSGTDVAAFSSVDTVGAAFQAKGVAAFRAGLQSTAGGSFPATKANTLESVTYNSSTNELMLSFPLTTGTGFLPMNPNTIRTAIPAPAFTGTASISYNLNSSTGWNGVMYFTNVGDQTNPAYGAPTYKNVVCPAGPIGSGWLVVEWNLTNNANWSATNATNINGVRFNLGASIYDIYEIDWISVGSETSMLNIDGVNVGTYIRAGAITNAYIGNVIQSDNYIAGVSGWQINKNGSSEFGGVTVRGTITGSTISGTSISGSTITGGTVTGANVVAGTLTTGKVAVGVSLFDPNAVNPTNYLRSTAVSSLGSNFTANNPMFEKVIFAQFYGVDHPSGTQRNRVISSPDLYVQVSAYAVVNHYFSLWFRYASSVGGAFTNWTCLVSTVTPESGYGPAVLTFMHNLANLSREGTAEYAVSVTTNDSSVGTGSASTNPAPPYDWIWGTSDDLRNATGYAIAFNW